ncbi:MAG: hypothetical protein FJ271_22475 [Planctomycetes bacterium]|nr:hypothetical protein [Planctomycetota bacterium]
MLGIGLLFLSAAVTADMLAQEKGKPRTMNATGVVSKVAADSLTLVQRGDSGERSTMFAIGAQTKILVQTSDDEVVKGEGGRERKTPKTKEGKAADLKVDQRVTVSYAEAGKADSILVLRPAPARKKEGER